MVVLMAEVVVVEEDTEEEVVVVVDEDMEEVVAVEEEVDLEGVVAVEEEEVVHHQGGQSTEFLCQVGTFYIKK